MRGFIKEKQTNKMIERVGNEGWYDGLELGKMMILFIEIGKFRKKLFNSLYGIFS